MPTENRSRNTEQMVLAPTALLERMRQRLIDIDQIHDFGPELWNLLNRDQPTSDGYSAGDMADQGAKAFRDGQRAGEALTFTLMHPLSKELRTVTLTKADVADGMEDTLYERLSEQICGCEPVGETNVVDCSCDEYVHDFDLISDSTNAEPEVNP